MLLHKEAVIKNVPRDGEHLETSSCIYMYTLMKSKTNIFKPEESPWRSINSP